MRAPDFWWMPKPTLAARLLSPLGWVYGAVTAKLMFKSGTRAALPVFCIGNFVAGGAGKTPLAIAIARRFQANGEKPVILSRGYRGAIKETPCLVDPARHKAQDVGDEALLLARIAPTIVGSDRAASAALAARIGASLVILDDGLQNAALVHDFRIAVADGVTGIGNGLCIPAGPLRASMKSQFRSISMLAVINESPAVAELIAQARTLLKPIAVARFEADIKIAQRLAGQKVVAFAGIGLPQKFQATLTGFGAVIAGWKSFPDHHVYSVAELRRLQAEAARETAFLVTTEKDYVRISPHLDMLDQELPMPVAVPGALIFRDEPALDDALLQALRTARIDAKASSTAGRVERRLFRVFF